MTNYYLKDLNILKVILLITVISAIALMGYSYYYSQKDQQYNINIAYNSGFNLQDEFIYNFSVFGNNNSNHDLTYNLYAYPGIIQDGMRYRDSDMEILLLKNDSIVKRIEPENLEAGLLLKQIVVNNNTGSFNDDYEIRLLVKNTADIINPEDKYYNINVKLVLVK